MHEDKLTAGAQGVPPEAAPAKAVTPEAVTLDRPVFLTGFMGCGKTTLGRAVSALCGIEFVDLDEAVEQRAGLTVSEIFARHGEAAFRQLERDELQRQSRRPVLIACGGGTPCQPGMAGLMGTLGTVVWLRADTDVLVRRLLEFGATRPLVAGKDEAQLRDFVAETLARRTPFYARCGHIFDSSRLETPEQVDSSAREFIRRFLQNNPRKDL